MEIFDQLKLENDDDNENNKQRRNDQFQAKHSIYKHSYQRLTITKIAVCVAYTFLLPFIRTFLIEKKPAVLIPYGRSVVCSVCV